LSWRNRAERIEGKNGENCLGKPLGVATPVNETVVGIITARERRMLGN